ncbi:hypothetical protein AMK16_15975 [Streptomyces sp. CB00455]|uniref:hypothetical protein n=1 Tax=Streptomyces sp. CB00455 TaxID=1703927 RepID=UPI00093ED2AD|nr:hypothetical protein [Streptomyces sp. CB00455]OKK19576.1 hypothetical protein AMK16_15975 [Streptomyces sp. CB00455]
MSDRLHFADSGEAADLAAFLGRLVHYDRAAAVRLQGAPAAPVPSGEGGGALAVFGRPPSFEVLAIRTVRLAEPVGAPLDRTVSAGEFLESVDEAAAAATVPGAVTGPPWTGVLPPRGGWRQLPGLPGPEEIRTAVAGAVAEFRSRDEALPAQHRTRSERDRIGREIWSRTLGDTELPLRAVHAAQSLGFLRPVRSTVPAAGPVSTGPAPLALLAAGSWLRLRTPYGSVAMRRPGHTDALGALQVRPV